MTGRMEEPPLTGIISNVLHAINGLVRNEVDLARAEVSESVERAGIALGMIAAAMVIGFVALNVLTGAVVSAVVEAGLAPGWARCWSARSTPSSPSCWSTARGRASARPALRHGGPWPTSSATRPL